MIGITGTPVIDPTTNTLYCVGNFQESNGTYQQRLYAMDIATGAVKDGGPVRDLRPRSTGTARAAAAESLHSIP